MRQSSGDFQHTPAHLADEGIRSPLAPAGSARLFAEDSPPGSANVLVGQTFGTQRQPLLGCQDWGEGGVGWMEPIRSPNEAASAVDPRQSGQKGVQAHATVEGAPCWWRGAAPQSRGTYGELEAVGFAAGNIPKG